MNFEYISENVVGPGLDPSTLEDQFEGCSCVGECSAASKCSCLFDGKPNYDKNGRFLYLPSSTSTSVHFECSNNCECILCPEKCLNRCIQLGIKFKLKVSKCDSEEKGFGVFAEEIIPSGHFVVEYVGELLSREEAEKRLQLTNQRQHNYLFTIREFIGGECRFTFIDGLYKGNISRFINHSCDPNLFLQVFRLGRALPSLAMFASRDIQKVLALPQGIVFSSVFGVITNISPLILRFNSCLPILYSPISILHSFFEKNGESLKGTLIVRLPPFILKINSPVCESPLILQIPGLLGKAVQIVLLIFNETESSFSIDFKRINDLLSVVFGSHLIFFAFPICLIWPVYSTQPVEEEELGGFIPLVMAIKVKEMIKREENSLLIIAIF